MPKVYAGRLTTAMLWKFKLHHYRSYRFVEGRPWSYVILSLIICAHDTSHAAKQFMPVSQASR
jgi:hypothetical protein